MPGKRFGFCLPVLLLVMMLPFAAAAQQENGEEASPAPEPFPESTSLWKVETDTSTVYLMGSIHFLKESDFPLHPKMVEAFDRAETLVLELDPDSAGTAAFQQYILAKAVYDSGRTLKSELGDSVYSILDTRLATLGLALDQMAQLEPWLVVLTYVNLKFQQLGFSPDFGIDLHFHKQAKAEGKPVRWLETPEDQIDVFDAMPPALQRALVLQTLEQAADIEQALDEILVDWKTGDLAGLDATLNRRFEEFPELRYRVLTKRNLDWIPKIETYIHSTGTHLIIMGVTHLSGDDGVVTLLRQAGYDVEQM